MNMILYLLLEGIVEPFINLNSFVLVPVIGRYLET